MWGRRRRATMAPVTSPGLGLGSKLPTYQLIQLPNSAGRNRTERQGFSILCRLWQESITQRDECLRPCAQPHADDQERLCVPPQFSCWAAARQKVSPEPPE